MFLIQNEIDFVLKIKLRIMLNIEFDIRYDMEFGIGLIIKFQMNEFDIG